MQPDTPKITVRPAHRISAEDFKKMKEALEKANIKGPFVKLTSKGFIWDDGLPDTTSTYASTSSCDGGSSSGGGDC